MTHEIEVFLDEVREAGKARGLITDEHVETIRSGLVNAFNAANESGELLDLWDAVHAAITQRGKSVKQRLVDMGKVAERWDEFRLGKSN